jgi:hypothetical protein
LNAPRTFPVHLQAPHRTGTLNVGDLEWSEARSWGKASNNIEMLSWVGTTDGVI